MKVFIADLNRHKKRRIGIVKGLTLGRSMKPSPGGQKPAKCESRTFLGDGHEMIESKRPASRCYVRDVRVEFPAVSVLDVFRNGFNGVG